MLCVHGCKDFKLQDLELSEPVPGSVPFVLRLTHSHADTHTHTRTHTCAHP